MSFGGFSWDAIMANKKQSLGAFAKIDVNALNYYNELLTKDGFDMSKALEGTEKQFGKLSEATKTYINNAGGAQVETAKLSKSFATLGAKGLIAQAGMMALNAALNVGISLAVAAVVNGITNLITAQERAIEKAQELQSGWKDSAQTLSETKSTVEGLKGEYETLAEGVDSLGNNVSLTADEYARYNQIANQIASMFPEMVRGYTAEGNAIIKNAGNVDELTAAYERLADAQRSTVVSEANDVIKGIQGQIKSNTPTGLWGLGGVDEYAVGSSTLRQYEAIKQYLKYSAMSAYGKLKIDAVKGAGVADSRDYALVKALQELGLTGSGEDWTDIAYNNKSKLEAYMRGLGSEISSAVSGYYPIIEAILGGDRGYKQLEDETKSLISSVIYGLEPTKLLGFEDKTNLETYLFESIVAPFEDASLTKTISDALDVKELVDDSVASFGHLETAYARVGKAVEGLAPEVQEAILSMFDLGEGDALIERLSDSVTDPSFLRNFTLDELRIAANIELDPNVDLDEEALRARISGVQEKVAQTVAEITNSYNQTTKAQDALNAAMSETEAIGAISAETYQSLIEANREFAYKLDDTNGYLNINYREAQKVIDAEYEMQKAQVAQAKAQNKLNLDENAKRLREISAALQTVNPKTEEYNKLIAEQAELQSDQSAILSEIKNLEILASTLAYATSAYKKWLDAQDAPEDSDIFDSLSGAIEQIQSGLETGKTGTRKYQSAAELIFGENWVNMSRAEIEAGLKNVEKYFTESSEGMRRGVDTLVKAGLMTKQGNEYFAVAGHDIEDFAAALGLGEEATRYFFSALRDYGWEIDIPGMGATTEQILAYEQAMDEAAQKQAEYQKLLSEFDPSKATQADIDAINEARKAYEEAQAEAESLKLVPEVEVPKTELETLQENLAALKAAYAELEGLALTGIVSPDVVEAFKTVQGGIDALDKMPEDGYTLNIKTGEDVAAVETTIKSLQDFIANVEAAEESGQISHDVAVNLTGNAKEQLEFLQAELAKYQGEGGEPDATVVVGADTKPASEELANLVDAERNATINAEVDPDDKAEIESWFSQFGNAFADYMGIKYGGKQPEEGTGVKPATPAGAGVSGISKPLLKEFEIEKQGIETEYEVDNSQAISAVDEVKSHAESTTPLIPGDQVVGEIPEIEIEVPNVDALIGADTSSAQNAINDLRSNASRPITIPVVVGSPGDAGGKTLSLWDRASGFLKNTFGFSKGTTNAPDGVALVGEGVKNGKYQPEIVVKSKTGEYFIADQPQLVDLDRGDQVINGDQTKKILGGKTPLGGKAFANGTLGSLVGGLFASLGVTASGSFDDTSSNKSSKKKSGNKTVDPKDLVDWIPTLLNNLKKFTEKLVKQAEKAIGYVAKNMQLDKALSNIELETSKNQAAYERYLKQAEAVGLSEDIKKLVQEGDIDIAAYDDKTRELISNYQKWYDLAQNCLDTVEDLKEQQIDLSKQKLENIVTYYENRIERLEAQATKGQDKIDLKSATGKEIFSSDYDVIIKATQDKMAELVEQRQVLNDEFEKLVAEGIIDRDSEAWHEYVSQLESLDSEIIQTQIDLSGFKDALANLPITNLQYAMNALQETQKVMENMMSLHEAQNADNEAGDYEKLIRNSIEQISNLEKQNILLREQLLGLDVLSEKYQEIQSQIADNEDEILNAKIAQEGWNDAILDLKISKLEQEREELEKTNDAYQRQKELQEALDDLEKAKRQKTVRIFKENVGFTFQQDRDALQEAQDRVNEVRHQETLDKIDEAIDALEDQKKDDNVYDYHGNLIKPFANGGIDAAGGLNLLHGSPSRVETIFNAEDGKKLFDLIHGSDNLTHELVKKFDASSLLHQIEGVSRGNVSTFTMGDIVIQHADDADGLAQDIIKYFPNALLTEMYKN